MHDFCTEDTRPQKKRRTGPIRSFQNISGEYIKFNILILIYLLYLKRLLVIREPNLERKKKIIGHFSLTTIFMIQIKR